MLASEYNLCQIWSPGQKSIFAENTLKGLISHNWRMSHQNLKKISGIHIEHKRNKISKNEGFFKILLFHAAWFLWKMAYNPYSLNPKGNVKL